MNAAAPAGPVLCFGALAEQALAATARGIETHLIEPPSPPVTAWLDALADRPRHAAAVVSDLDSLRDGKGELSLFWNQIFFFTGTAALRDRLPEGEILDAVLIVDGTPYSKKDRKWKWKRRARRR